MPRLDQYDRPFINASGQTIPAYAVLQVGGWDKSTPQKQVFLAVKPNGQGKQYMLNGPVDVPVPSASNTGRGSATRENGAHALFDQNLSTPQPNQELGPVAGSWALGTGQGFFVVGDIEGAPASLPGFPLSPSTLRVRVTMQATGSPPNPLVRFELKENKNLPSPPFSLAYLLDDQDAKILDDQNNPIEIYVIDRPPTIYAGFGPYNDLKYGQQPGNRGWAQFKIGDYAGGLPGYEIIAMDGQARWILGTLAADWDMASQSGEIEPTKYWGAAPNNRPPKTEEKDYGGGGTGQPSNPKNIVRVYDPAKLRATTMSKDALVYAVLDELAQQYILAAVPPKVAGASLFKLQTTVSAATFPGALFQPGTGLANRWVPVENSNPKQWSLDATQTVTLYNSVTSVVPNQKTVQTKIIDGLDFIDVEDCT